MANRISKFLLLIAMALAGYLALNGFSPSPLAGCGEASGCDEVLNSEWSSFLGVPVAVFAFLAYGAMLALSFIVPKGDSVVRDSASRSILVLLATASVAAILWFVVLQVFVIGSICVYCMIDHAVGLIACGLILAASIQRKQSQLIHADEREPAEAGIALKARRLVVPAALGVGLVIAFAGIQIATVPDTHSITQAEVKETQVENVGRVIAVGDQGQYRFEIERLPILGSPAAEHIIIAMVDYRCGDCHAMNNRLVKALELYGDQLAVVYLPMPLNGDCNPHYTGKPFEGSCELSRLALAVGRLDRTAYAQFHSWLIEQSPTPELARRYADKLVGTEALTELIDSGWVEGQLRMNVDAHKAIGGGGVPRLLIGSDVVAGTPRNPEALFEILEKKYSLKPKGWDILESK